MPKPGAWILAISLLFLIIYHGYSLLAQMYSIPARRLTDSLSIINPEQRGNLHYTEALLYLDRSMTLLPENEAFCLLAGELHLAAGGYSGNEALRHWREGKESFQAVIDRSPANSYAWSRFAAAKGLLGETDEEFNLAYQKAFEYAGWNYSLVQSLAEVGFSSWESLDGESRLRLKEVMKKLYDWSPHKAVLLAGKYGYMRMACLWMLDHKTQLNMCRYELED